jgi:23S rRNA (cytosine1962-C5)-methyltransferase
VTTVYLKPGREGPVRAGHPWIFSGAIGKFTGDSAPGTLVEVCTADGQPLGIGYCNPRCSIAVRMLTRTVETIDAHFIHKRLEAAFTLRRVILPPATTGYRLINGEGDWLPGLIVDVYGNFLVCQFLTAGMEGLKPLIVNALATLLTPRGIYEKSEGGVRQEEGLPNAAGVLWGEEAPRLVTLAENGCQFLADIKGGQKTGFFFDQRDNRSLVGSVATGKQILNGFCYTGGFSVFAAKGGAQGVLSVDSSRSALQLAQKNWEQNALPAQSGEFLQADMFSYLRETDKQFDLIVLDPPPFIRRRQDRQSGVKGYKDVNLHAFRRISPGGFLLTFSCSQHLSVPDFLQTVLFAAVDAQRPVQVLRHLGPGADHPTALAHGEGSYLKGLWLQIGD